MKLPNKNTSLEGIKKDILHLLKLDESLINLNKDNIYKLFKRHIIKNKILENNYLHLKNNFIKFIPETFINTVSKGILEDIKIGSNKEKDLHIMFIDISGFTEISEYLKPEKALQLLNIYFDGIVEISNSNGGYIDKFLGDGIMLVFDEKNSDNVLKTAIEIIELVNKINISNFKDKINIGIGINSGKAILGTIGSKNRMDITIIGDTVNTASRIENSTREEKEWILFSESTYNLLKEKNLFNIKYIGEKELRGKRSL
ncbi:MAG: adenylate/guanylate cyclase domain-containing protein [Candidatus Gracilibacteria bacterium]|nr:adenylate/guanylate cyclase domain-containing protein [Candidatus Gracilibacteria bacterium]